MESIDTLNCLIVEDEPLAALVLEDYIQQVPFLHFVGRCADAFRASEVLKTQPIDVLFLDIHLPGIKGLDFLRSIPHAPQTILTTAYHEYALEGYDLNVVDYLLKPIAMERFMQAIQKIHRTEPTGGRARAFHFFNVNKKMVRVWLDEIVLVESLKEYIRIYLKGGNTLITKYALSSMETLLPSRAFLRTHRSFIVAVAHIEAYTPIEIIADGRSIPVGRQYRDSVLEGLGKL